MLQLVLPGDTEITIDDPTGFKFTESQGTGTIGAVISELIKYAFPLAGLILFLMLIMGGFSLLASGGNPESIKKGQSRIVSALIGFVIVFVAYWLVQLLQTVLGLQTIFGSGIPITGTTSSGGAYHYGQ